MMRRRKLISNGQLVMLLGVGLCATLISVAAGEQQGMITKPYMRGLGSRGPCVKNPDPHHPENSDPASTTEFASTDDEANFFIPARRQLADDSGSTAGGVVGVIFLIVIVVSIVWCCCTGRCGGGRQVVVVQTSQEQTSTQAQHAAVTAPVSVTQHVTVPEQKPPTIHLTLQTPFQQQPAVPTPGVGEVEMVQEPVLGPARAGGNHYYAHPGVVRAAPAPQVGNSPGKVPADVGAPGSPAPGYPAYTHQGPPAQYKQQ